MPPWKLLRTESRICVTIDSQIKGTLASIINYSHEEKKKSDYTLGILALYLIKRQNSLLFERKMSEKGRGKLKRKRF